MRTGLYELGFDDCALCGFTTLIVGELVPVQMIGPVQTSNGMSMGPVPMKRCHDAKGCARRRWDFPAERPWATED